MNTECVQRTLERILEIKFSRPIECFSDNASRMAYRYEGQFKAKESKFVMEDKPLASTRIGKWRDKVHAKRIIEQFTLYPELFDILVNDGYEKNNEWFELYRE